MASSPSEHRSPIATRLPDYQARKSGYRASPVVEPEEGEGEEIEPAIEPLRDRKGFRVIVGSAVPYLDYKKARGRPSLKTPALVEEIMFRLAGGEPLTHICRDDHMPAIQKIYEWAAADEEFSGNLARARELSTHAIADNCMEISDRGDMDARDRQVRIDTRLRLIEKWNRKDYGQKQDINHSGTISLEAWVLEAQPRQIEQARVIEQKADKGPDDGSQA